IHIQGTDHPVPFVTQLPRSAVDDIWQSLLSSDASKRKGGPLALWTYVFFNFTRWSPCFGVTITVACGTQTSPALNRPGGPRNTGTESGAAQPNHNNAQIMRANL